MSAGAANVAPLNARVSFARCFSVPVIRPRARCCRLLLVGLIPLMTVFLLSGGLPRRCVVGARIDVPYNGRTRKRRFCHAARRFLEETAQRHGCSCLFAPACATFL